MATVVKWTGREARALRKARRMSVRDFARHLGFNDAAVSNWESRGDQARLRHNTQEVLDTDLAQAPNDVQERFQRALAHEGASGLAENSRTRTAKLIESIRASSAATPEYAPPADAVESVRGFLQSPSRIYLINGPAGCGKTSFTYHLADELATEADIQLMSLDLHDRAEIDVAVEILRYGSVAAQQDGLLTLEAEAEALSKPCLVVIDGIKSQEQFDQVARHVEVIVRQVTSSMLRFALVIRTPPNVETTAHPVLTASIFEPAGMASSHAPSYELSRWTLDEARLIWSRSKSPGDTSFDALPVAVQQLIRVPLYLKLVLTTGPMTSTGGATAFELVDHCVRQLLRQAHDDVEQTIANLADLAQRDEPDLVPAALDGSRAVDAHPPREVDAIVRTGSTGTPEFLQDVLREYALATRIASLLRVQGRSVATVGALNQLAERAHTSSTARNVFEFVLSCLDRDGDNLLPAAAMSPTISIEGALPQMIAIAAESNAAYATPEVLRACADRCDSSDSLELARALLVNSSTLQALGDQSLPWFLGLLRRFGSSVWDCAMTFIETNLDASHAHKLLRSADLEHGDEATFFARHFFLFFGENTEEVASLEALLDHHDWRVRAALADGVRDPSSVPTASTKRVLDRLTGDGDYKVRAAAALAITRIPSAAATQNLATLLTNENWHVRERVLYSLAGNREPNPDTDALVTTALELVSTDRSWRACPAHVLPALQRLQLLHGDSVDEHRTTPRRALFDVLRELRTGWTQLPDDDRERVVALGRHSDHWLIRREADALDGTDDAGLHRDDFRRLRGQRSIQVALDMHDLDAAVSVAKASAAAGVDLLEVGDPLIKEVGLRAIEEVKQNASGATVIAEMMSADWGRDQVMLAAESGADAVLLIGPATTASVSAAVQAGRRLGVPILLDCPQQLLSRRWIKSMERAGVDGFTVTTNIDIGIGTRNALAGARTIRMWTKLPVAVSGGFSATDTAAIGAPDWDILIVGRSIADAVDPDTAARRITELVHDSSRSSA